MWLFSTLTKATINSNIQCLQYLLCKMYSDVIMSLCSFSVMAVFFKCMETGSFHSVT